MLVLMLRTVKSTANPKKGNRVTKRTNIPVMDTVTRRYAGANRRVNVFNATTELGDHLIYWDQATGIMLELFVRAYYSYTWITVGYTDFRIKATETNIFLADLPALILNNVDYILAAIIVTIVIVILIVVIKRGSRRGGPRHVRVY